MSKAQTGKNRRIIAEMKWSKHHFLWYIPKNERVYAHLHDSFTKTDPM